MRKAISSLIIMSFLLMGCATAPDKVKATYVSPMEYSDYSCKQIRAEMSRVGRKVHEITGQQQDEADGDAVALGVGLVLFWPALFFMMGDDQEEELASLKGQYDALEQAAIQKDCDVADEIAEARRLEAERQAERKEMEREVGGVND